MKLRTSACIAAVIGGIAAGVGCGGSSAASSSTLDECQIGGAVAECTTISVLEDPSRPEGRTIDLSVAVVRATEFSDQPPIFWIAGGPGQGAQFSFGAMLSAFDDLHAAHDFVYVDQRGTGKSGALNCAQDQALDLVDVASLKVDRERLDACREGQQADLTQYTTQRAIDDLAVVMERLGYAKAHLIGSSYGTRVALAFARAYPQQTASIVIDGVAPPDFAMPLSFAKDAQAALDALVSDCLGDVHCGQAFPTLREQLDALVTRPDDDVAVEHPRTGAQTTLPLNGRTSAAGMRSMLYAPELAALLPLSIDAASRGDYDPLVAQAVLLGDNMGSGLAEGMFLSVICAEDVPFITDEQVARQTRDTAFGSMFVDNLRDSCEGWPRAEVPPSFREPVRSQVPALVLSGAVDPVTPARWGEHALEGLPNGRHVVVPGAGHGIVALPCADGVLAEFFATGDAKAVDASCLEARERPPFFIDFAGPVVNP